MRKETQRLVLAICLAAVAALASAKMPPNSFLMSPVRSTHELVKQVKANAKVRDRYKRHFAMTSNEVISFLSKLKLSKLKQAGEFEVYNVPSSGLLRAKMRRLKVGTPIFVDAAGTPVLMVICGNPLMRGPSKPFGLGETVAPPVARDVALLPMRANETFEAVQEQVVAEVVAPEVPATLNPPAKTPVGPLGPLVIHSGAKADFGVLAPTPTVSSWAPLPAAFLVFAIPQFTGGRFATPEPAAFATLALGGGLGWALMRRFNSQRMVRRRYRRFRKQGRQYARHQRGFSQ